MKALLKWGGGAVVALLVLVIAAALILPMVINPNDYKEQITQAVHDKTGMTLNIKGDISWSVFPWVGLSLKNLAIDDTQQQPLGTLNHVSVKVKLMPLLQKQLDISTVELNGLKLNMVVDKNGQPNWQPRSSGTTASSQQKPEPSAQEEGNGSTPLLADLNVAGVSITDISVNYQDIPAGQTVSITNAELKTGAISFGKPFTLLSSFLVEQKSTSAKAATKAKVALGGMITPNPELASYTIDDLKLSVTPVSKGEAKPLVVSGRVAAKGSTVSGKIAIEPVDIAMFMKQVNVALPKMAGGDKVLRKVGISTVFKADQNSLALSDLQAAVDGIELKGSLAVTDLKKQAITFDLKGNDVAVDSYMPVAEGASVDKPATQAPAAQPAQNTPVDAAPDTVIIPVDLIKSLNVHGKAQLASLTAKGFRFDKPNLEIKAANGYAQLSSLNAGFYQGAIKAAAAVDVRGRLEKNPQVSVKADVDGIDIPALAKQITGLQNITGQANANLKVVTHGLTQQRLTEGLNGTVNFDIADGALLGANFNQMVCGLIAKVRKEKSTKTDWPNQTAFQKLQGSVKIIEGVARNNDLTAALDQINLKGDGYVDLGNQMLDYHVGLTITGDTGDKEDSACRINEKYANITWPVRCQGKLGDSGLCGIDEQRLGNVLGKIAEQEIKSKLQKKLEDSLDKKLKGSLKDSLKGLFN